MNNWYISLNNDNIVGKVEVEATLAINDVAKDVSDVTKKVQALTGIEIEVELIDIWHC